MTIREEFNNLVLAGIKNLYLSNATTQFSLIRNRHKSVPHLDKDGKETGKQVVIGEEFIETYTMDNTARCLRQFNADKAEIETILLTYVPQELDEASLNELCTTVLQKMNSNRLMIQTEARKSPSEKRADKDNLMIQTLLAIRDSLPGDEIVE